MDTPHQGLTCPEYTTVLAEGFEHGLKVASLGHLG
jgi:hypothetical protein